MHPKRVDWRQDAGLTDGGYHKVDLVGGYFVDHDFVKFGFPMASSMTLLAWSVIEFKNAYVASNEYRVAMDALKWGADYFIKCHTNPFEFYGQVRHEFCDFSHQKDVLIYEKIEFSSHFRLVKQKTQTNTGDDQKTCWKLSTRFRSNARTSVHAQI